MLKIITKILTSSVTVLGLVTNYTKDGYDVTVDKVSQLDVNDGQRVLAGCTVIADEQQSGSVKSKNVILNYLYNVLSQSPLLSNKAASQRKQDSLEYDLVEVSDAWVSSKHMNIQPAVLRQIPELMHLVNLVVGQERSTVSQVYLEFRKDAFNYVPALKRA